MDALAAAERLRNFAGVGISLERGRLEDADGNELSPDATWDAETGKWVSPTGKPGPEAHALHLTIPIPRDLQALLDRNVIEEHVTEAAMRALDELLQQRT